MKYLILFFALLLVSCPSVPTPSDNPSPQPAAPKPLGCEYPFGRGCDDFGRFAPTVPDTPSLSTVDGKCRGHEPPIWQGPCGWWPDSWHPGGGFCGFGGFGL